MFGVSLLYTLAFALSITRYKLMQAEEFINRGMVYVAFSVTAGLLYSGVLVLSGWLSATSSCRPTRRRAGRWWRA